MPTSVIRLVIQLVIGFRPASQFWNREVVCKARKLDSMTRDPDGIWIRYVPKTARKSRKKCSTRSWENLAGDEEVCIDGYEHCAQERVQISKVRPQLLLDSHFQPVIFMFHEPKKHPESKCTTSKMITVTLLDFLLGGSQPEFTLQTYFTSVIT